MQSVVVGVVVHSSQESWRRGSLKTLTREMKWRGSHERTPVYVSTSRCKSASASLKRCVKLSSGQTQYWTAADGSLSPFAAALLVVVGAIFGSSWPAHKRHTALTRTRHIADPSSQVSDKVRRLVEEQRQANGESSNSDASGRRRLRLFG